MSIYNEDSSNNYRSLIRQLNLFSPYFDLNVDCSRYIILRVSYWLRDMFNFLRFFKQGIGYSPITTIRVFGAGT